METVYRVSRLSHLFERDGIVALFHALTYEVLYFDTQVKALLSFFEGGSTVSAALDQFPEEQRKDVASAIKELVASELLIAVEVDEMLRIEDAANRLVGFPEISILYLLLTGQCNLRCRYCFVETPHMPTTYKSAMMTREVARLGIDIYAKALAENSENKLKTRNVYYYGGEPLLNWDVLEWSARYMRELVLRGVLPESLVINMVTNGTLVTREIAETLAGLGVQVSVSLDGPRDITEKNRGSGIYDDVIRGIRLLQDAGMNVGISCTIAGNEDSLPKIVEWLHYELGVSSLGFNVLMGNETKIGVGKEYFETAAAEMLKAYEVARSLGVYEDRVTRKVRSFSDQTIYPKDCGGCGRQIVVTADGLVGPCHAYAGDGQDYYKPLTSCYNPLNDRDIMEWSKRSPLTMPECKGCFAVGICGGGCAYHADRNYGSIWSVDDRFCYQAKSTVEWLVWDLYSQDEG
jgi:uncharacterized protein